MRSQSAKKSGKPRPGQASTRPVGPTIAVASSSRRGTTARPSGAAKMASPSPGSSATRSTAHCTVSTKTTLPGVSTAAAPLAQWVAAGAHGDMGYMAETPHLRGDPHHLLPEARSVVCVAMSYHTGPEPPELDPGHGRAVAA